LHGPDAKADLTFCQQCHADPSGGGPGSNPRFNVPLGNLANGCEDCHQVNTAHPVPLWAAAPPNSHKTAGNLAVACALCHGANLQGGVGPACAICHTAGSPLDLVNCTSCHNDPPDSAFPAGNSRPNRDGSHSDHDLLPKVTSVCITCHNGSGTDTINHFDGSEPSDVSALPSYDAKTGTAAYDSGSMSCTDVSCHGGQPTPDWLTGVIDVGRDCESCHELGTAQFNSYNSGEHDEHLDEGIGCTECHDTGKLAGNHFIGLDTPAFEEDPAQTIRDDVNYSPPSCNPACHRRESWVGDDDQRRRFSRFDQK
jgi:predicted CxxxxCH...CXXCH cytochrome family protein